MQEIVEEMLCNRDKNAHPDIGLPYDSYTGYHAMSLIAAMGMGDENLMEILPAKYDVKITFV